MLSTLTPVSFAPDAMSAEEALRTATLPERPGLAAFADRNRTTSAPADFWKVHTRSGEITGGLVCRTHSVWHTDAEGRHVECAHCDRAIERRIARRIEQIHQHIVRLGCQGRYGR